MKLDKEVVINYVNEIQKKLDDRDIHIDINVDSQGNIHIESIPKDRRISLCNFWNYEKKQLEQFVEQTIRELV